MRVLRVYHGGLITSHRARERALLDAGVDLTLVAPLNWPEAVLEPPEQDAFRTIRLPVSREGDVNRHSYAARKDLRRLIGDIRPDVLDIQEEPFSVASRQWLAAAPVGLPIVMYTAQNIDKRYPPPFAQFERAAHKRVTALYPCSAQAASVARGKGFSGQIDVLPLGYDDAIFVPGPQSTDDAVLQLAFCGRLVPEKGLADAIRILALVQSARPAKLIISGTGPEEASARELARTLKVLDRIDFLGWQSPSELASAFRLAHFVLVPSRPTESWAEQFGRVIIEARASGAVVAAYASGAIPEVAAGAGLLVPTGDFAQLAACIVEAWTNPEEYTRRREEGMALSGRNTWAHIADRQFNLYRSVCDGNRVRKSLPHSPQRRRAAARVEFGSTVETVGGPRPFALRYLRQSRVGVSEMEWLLDMGGELAARIRAKASTR